VDHRQSNLNVQPFPKLATTTPVLSATTIIIMVQVARGFAPLILELTVEVEGAGASVSERLVFILVDGVVNLRTGGAYLRPGTTGNGTGNTIKPPELMMPNGWLSWNKIMLVFRFGLMILCLESSGKNGLW
jgi:hypothetical protein